MDALLKLGLELPDTAHAHPWLDRFLTVQDWVAKAFESVKELAKDGDDLTKALEKVAPWVGIASKAVPPAHFLFEVVKELTKEKDPKALAIIACTVAYQAAAHSAIAQIGLPDGKSVEKAIADSIAVTKSDFSYFTLQTALSHPFIRNADQVLEFYAAIAGYTRPQIEQIVRIIHDRFSDELREVITQGESRDKFAVLLTWLGTDSKEAAARAALRRHVQYSKWLFEEAPVLDHEPYALKDIYVDTGCGVLTRRQLMEKGPDGRSKRDPFHRDPDNGGTSPLLETVLNFIRDPKFNDVIVIQGSAGSGKSTLTKFLSARLASDGLHPIRIRLRDVEIGRELLTTLGEAIQLEDEIYLTGANQRWPRAGDLLKDSNIFQDEVSYDECRLCPYILILDGWDEISLDVTEGFKQKVKDLLHDIRFKFFGSGRPRVRVILTGRPSDAIDDSSNFFNDDTPILTVRPLDPDQLDRFADNLRNALESRPLPNYKSDWTMPKKRQLKPLTVRYRKSFEDPNINQEAEILGIPFLAQLAFRVIADPGPDGDKVVEDASTLLRRLTEITIANADVPTEQVGRKKSKGAAPPVRVKNRIRGSDLRNLLQQTAAKMTIASRESISHNELEEYLVFEGLESLLAEAEKSNIVTALMISFFFKGGNSHLGCEFTHKALREYLFAEAVLQCLRSFADCQKDSPSLAERQPYWRDFDGADPRQDWSRQVTRLLAPQWLSAEVLQHLKSLIAWELQRAGSPEEVSGATTSLSLAQWQFIRDGMADLWDWWGEGVAMRPQVAVNPDSKQVVWKPAILQNLIEQNHPLPKASSLATCVPPRLTTYDAHLGAALMQLTALDPLRNRQTAQSGWLGRSPPASPSRPSTRRCSRALSPFLLQARIGLTSGSTAPASTQPDGIARLPFPPMPPFRDWTCAMPIVSLMSFFLGGLDLEQTSRAQTSTAQTCVAQTSTAQSSPAQTSPAQTYSAQTLPTHTSPAQILTRANLTRADLTGAEPHRCNPHRRKPHRRNPHPRRLVTDAYLTGANLSGADLLSTNLTDAYLTGADPVPAQTSPVQTSPAQTSYGADLTKANLDGVIIPEVQRSSAIFQ